MEPFLFDIPGLACQSARAWASQTLDGELSDLEQAALEAHLTDCAGCARFVASMGFATLAVRATPALEPERAWTGVAVARGSSRRKLAVVAAAAAVAASVFLGGAIGTFTHHGGDGASAGSAPGGFLATQQPYREQSLLALLPRLHQPPSRVVAV